MGDATFLRSQDSVADLVERDPSVQTSVDQRLNADFAGHFRCTGIVGYVCRRRKR